MPQHDYNIANDTAANVRSDLNNALSAIATNNSGTSEPSVTYANQWWYDTANDLLKIRNEANSAWIDFATVNQADGRIEFSTVYADNFSDGTLSIPADSVTQGTAKAWSSIAGTGTASIDNSFNAASLTDNGTGNYTISFTNPFATAFFGSTCSSSLTGQLTRIQTRTTGSFQTQSVDVSGTAQDSTTVVQDINGDLA